MRAPSPTWATPALAVAALVLCARSLFGGSTMFLRDHLSLVTPARYYLGSALRSGRFPQWWDGVGLGVPFAANPMHGCFYPLSWLAALAPGSMGADLVIVVHLLVLGLGVASFSRRLGASESGAFVAGAIVMASGYVASMMQNGVPLMTLAWLPWVACGADSMARVKSGRAALRPTLSLAAFLGLAILAGDPAGAIEASLLALVVVSVRSTNRWRGLLGLAMASLAALVLAAIVIIPALHLATQGSRASGIEASAAMDWSMHPLRMLEWAIPSLLGDPGDPRLNLAQLYANTSSDASMGPSWSLSVFLGLPALLLVARSGQRGLLWASLLFVLLALGKYTPLYGLYRAVFFPEQAIRFPARHFAGALILWSSLAGVGWTLWLGKPSQDTSQKQGSHYAWTRRIKVAAAFVFFFMVAAFLLQDRLASHLTGRAIGSSLDGGAAYAIVLKGLVAAALSMLVFVASDWALRNQRRGLAVALASGALLIPLCQASIATRPVVDRALVSGTPALLQSVSGKLVNGTRPRLYRNRLSNPPRNEDSMGILAASLYHTAKPNMGAAAGFAYVPGYDPSLTNRLRSMWEQGASQGARLLQLFDIEYVFLPARVAQGSGMSIVASSVDSRLVLARQSHRRPRAFVAASWHWVRSDAEARAVLFSSASNLANLEAVQLLGEGLDSTASLKGTPYSPCVIDSPRPERVNLICTSSTAGYAVLLDAWFPGWSARVDGVSAPILRADGLVRAVPVSAGRHEITFRYQTPGLRIGLLLSGAGWLLWLLAWTRLRSSRGPGVG